MIPYVVIYKCVNSWIYVHKWDQSVSFQLRVTVMKSRLSLSAKGKRGLVHRHIHTRRHAFVHTVDTANVMIWYDMMPYDDGFLSFWNKIMERCDMRRYFIRDCYDCKWFIESVQNVGWFEKIKSRVATDICGFKRKILMFSLVLYGHKRFIVCAYEKLNWFKRNFNLFVDFRRDKARDVFEWVYIFLMNMRYHIYSLKRLLCNRDTEGECE